MCSDPPATTSAGLASIDCTKACLKALGDGVKTKSVVDAGNQNVVAVEDESEESIGSDDADNSTDGSCDDSEVSDASEQEEAALADTDTSSADLVMTPERVRPSKRRRQSGSDDAHVYV